MKREILNRFYGICRIVSIDELTNTMQWSRPGQWTGPPMGSPGQYYPNSVEAHLIFKWTGLLMDNKNRAKIGPNAGHLLG